MKKDSLASQLKYASLITYFGVSAITPLVLILLLCNYLIDRHNFPPWIMIVGVIVGFAALIYGFIDMIRKLMRMNDRDEQ